MDYQTAAVWPEKGLVQKLGLDDPHAGRTQGKGYLLAGGAALPG